MVTADGRRYHHGMRTTVALRQEQIEALAKLCEREGVSRAEMVRRAVDAYLRRHVGAEPDEAFGLWRDAPVDALAYQHRRRDEWT